MAQQSINIGAAANDGSGDPLRTAFDKINDNFSELYTVSGAGPGNNIAFSGNSIISEDSSGDIILDPNGTGRVVVATASELRFTDHVDNAVAYVDADGDMQFNSNLTFNGTTLAVTGATTVSTTLGVTGESTLASATVSDLTSGRVVYASTSGSLVDNANLTFDGTNFTVGGRLNIVGNKITTLTSNEDLEIDPAGTGTLNITVPTQSTVGSAGGANAVPATPTTYFKIKVNGVEYVIPAFAVS
jgi:hypothetical protein